MKTDEQWYALRVRVRSEAVAFASLTYYGVESYWPHTVTQGVYSGRVKKTSKSVLPGYMFCRFALSSKARVLASNGVDGIVSLGSSPTPIPWCEIDAIRKTVEAGGVSAPVPTVGDRVRVTDGYLSGLEGVLVRESHKTRFVVSVQLIQQAVSVSIDRASVECL